MKALRQRALAAIAANREPGFHFAGNFCGVAFHREAGGSKVTLEPGAHCVDADGQVNWGVMAMVADMALAASIRAGLDPRTRLATVSMSLQFTGAPRVGPMVGRGTAEGFFGGGDSRQGLARVTVECGGTTIGFGHGAFMALEPPPGIALFPLPGPDRLAAPPVPEAEFTPDELELLRHVDATLGEQHARGDFIGHLFGYQPRRTRTGATGALRNGSHVANRVGHVQGGILMGFAAATAQAALPHSWALAGISACFVSPGQGAVLHATSRVLHHGLMTSVVQTEITGANRRRILEAVTTHSRIVGNRDPESA